MKIAMVGAGFTPAEADELRSMATFKSKGQVTKFEKKLTEGMTQRGYSLEYSQRVFKQLEGFGSYGFPESHAASFALLVYVSSWIKCFYPDVFCCSLLNSMPMGFYHPAQIISDARKHGVEVRPVDINYSSWDNILEQKPGKYHSLRLCFRQVNGLKKDDIDLLLLQKSKLKAGNIPQDQETSFSQRPEQSSTFYYATINQLRDTGISQNALQRLAEADGFRSIGLDRQEALWEISTRHQPAQMFKGHVAPDAIGERVSLPGMTQSEHVGQDYATTSFSLKAHPVFFIREKAYHG